MFPEPRLSRITTCYSRRSTLPQLLDRIFFIAEQSHFQLTVKPNVIEHRVAVLLPKALAFLTVRPFHAHLTLDNTESRRSEAVSSMAWVIFSNSTACIMFRVPPLPSEDW